ncbi:asparaginase [Dolosigranulum pigrum]|uniref:asparaginase n=1 Tax=Dolosigranulum pigrum TaxID=29394 RepID=UPI001AD86C93|nr:asparaginase [Dolosigranulum pigrum]QTJ51810.1 asparaginase [Dolosigranulum pigrum]
MEQLVKIITTGGTITSLPDENGDVLATMSGDELIAYFGIEKNIAVKNSVKIDSSNFDYALMLKVASDVIDALEDPEVTGVVVTHGTDTMEESAFYLSLMTYNYNKPVILTGAQFDPSYSFSDGIKNMHDAIYAAKSPKLASCGAVIVFAGFIYAARDVIKVDTNSLEAFDSPGWGPIGRVDNEKVIIARQPSPSVQLSPKKIAPVALIRLGIGMTDVDIRKMSRDYKGVVIEAFGRGNAHITVQKEVKALTEAGIPVIITSRCLRGEVKPYYGDGGGKDLERSGAWFAGDLAGEKARVLLGLMLANQIPWSEMEQIVSDFSQPAL